MNLSRAIFNILKKLSVIALIVFPCSLFADGYRVSAVSNSDGYMSIMNDALSLLMGEVTSPVLSSEHSLRIEKKNVYENDRIRSAEAVSEKPHIEAEQIMSEGPLLLEPVPVEYGEKEIEFLMDGDEYAVEYLLLKNDLDMIITADVSDEGQISVVVVRINGKELRTAAYLSTDEEGEFLSLLEALLPVFRDERSVIVSVEGAGDVALTDDGRPLLPVRKTLVMDKGPHRIRYSSSGSIPYTDDVDIKEGSVLSPNLESVYVGGVFVSSIPYDASIFYQGVRVGDHIALNGSAPYSITALSPGFSLLMMQGSGPSEKIRIEMKPFWMDESGRVERSKRSFYNELLVSILSFGAYVATASLSGIYGNEVLEAVSVGFMGLSIVNLVELVDSMFKYYRAARLGI